MGMGDRREVVRLIALVLWSHTAPAPQVKLPKPRFSDPTVTITIEKPTPKEHQPFSAGMT